MFALRSLRTAGVVARPAAIRTAAPLSTSSIRLSKPTESEQASKAHHHSHTPEDLQRHTAAEHANERRHDKLTASPNEEPTESEDVAHAHRNHDHESPETLQEKTTKKARGEHH